MRPASRGFVFHRRGVVRELLQENGRVVGVRAILEEGEHNLRADLVIGTDGRSSIVRRRGGYAWESADLPMDIVWCKLPWPDVWAGRCEFHAYLAEGHLLVLLAAPDGLLQVGWVILKGTYRDLRERGVPGWLNHLAGLVEPEIREHFRSHADDPMRPFVLDAQADRVRGWSRPGVLLLGDAAHTMSPVGAQGINVALRDAVVAANHLVEPLRSGASLEAIDAAAARIEAERGPDIDAIQALAARPPRLVLAPGVGGRHLPAPDAGSGSDSRDCVVGRGPGAHLHRGDDQSGAARMSDSPASLRIRICLVVALSLGWPPARGLSQEAPAPEDVPVATPSAGGEASPTPSDPAPGLHPRLQVDAARLGAADSQPGQWMAHGRTWSEQRFSPLRQIDEQSVARLGPAWVHTTGTHRGLEATPLVVDGVMIATLTWSRVLALDARTGAELWRYDPEVPRAWGRHACCDVVNRGVAWWEGRVYVGTLDGRLIALDAKTGELAWSVQTTDPTRPYTITGAPRVANGKVFIGNGGGEFGVRGYVSAYDAATGERLWRFYTVPASKDGPHEHAEMATAAATWSRDSTFESGLGGTVWDSMAFDPELDLLYVGVGNSNPYNRELRSPGGGDNLFLASILAIRPDSGELVWHYQTTPAENWDYTATQHMILADLELAGRPRKVLMQAPKNGFFYVLDRETGELISADAYAEVNWASHVDLSTGRPVETGRAEWKDGIAWVVPGPGGAHNWHPMAFHPGTGLVYIPSQDMAYPFEPDPDHVHKPGYYNTSEDFPALAAQVDGYERALHFCSPTHLTAWDPVARKRVWRVSHDSEVNGGALATAGGLVFQGGGGGRLSAYRASDGERLWSSDLGVGIMAPPISYAVDGVQYVAVVVGVGGSAGLNFTVVDYENDGFVVAFRLDGRAPLPAPRSKPPGRVRVTTDQLDPQQVEQGRVLYGTHCFRCHGTNAISGGLLPDLRHASKETHEQWRPIVLGGTLANRGMASFADVLTPAEVDAIQHYVVSQALREPSALERLALFARQQGLCIPARWLAD